MFDFFPNMMILLGKYPFKLVDTTFTAALELQPTVSLLLFLLN